MFSVHYYDWTSAWKSGHKSSDTGNISGESLGEIRRKKKDALHFRAVVLTKSERKFRQN